MSNDWNNLVKEASPREIEANNKKLKEIADKERYSEKVIDDRAYMGWAYETRRFETMLGWKVVGKLNKTHSYVSGEEFVLTSSNTFERRDKKSTFSKKYLKLQLDKSKIMDLEKYKQLEAEILEFQSQATMKMGSNITPALLKNEEVLTYFTSNFKKSTIIAIEVALIVGGAMTGGILGAILFGLGFPLLCVGCSILTTLVHRKKYAAYTELVDAYFEKVKEFEERIKEITCF